jgi:aspartate racemase
MEEQEIEKEQNNMKKIGLIGGMSWESTLLYYELINKKVKKELGGLHSSNCVIESVDFNEIALLQADDDWKRLDLMMVDRALSLQNSGAELILICANTMHLCVDAIQNRVDVPIVHIAEVTAGEIRKAKLEKVALLGTKFTMEKTFFRDILRNHAIEVLIPDADARDVIHDIIYKELVCGDIKQESKAAYLEIIDTLRNQGAQGVILGCTEIPLLIGPEDVDLPLFNTTQIHAEKAVELALQ